MKVFELFEAQGQPGQGGKYQSGAYYRPHYDQDAKHLRGSVKDWLDGMNISKEDVAKALAQVKASPLFRNDFPAAGLMYAPTAGKEKNGTLSFKVVRKLPNGKTYQTGYDIHANGLIRWTGERGWGSGNYTTPLKSPKPRLKAGDPVGSLVMTYKASLEELLNKWKKSSDRMEKAAAKEAGK